MTAASNTPPPEPEITGPFHRLERLGYLPYCLPGGNPRTGKLSPKTTIKPSNFGKVPAELNSQGLYRGMAKWTQRPPTTREEARVWQNRGENQLLRTGTIATFPDDMPALIAIDCDAETAEMSAAFLAAVEKKFGSNLSLRRRPGKPHRWLALIRGTDEAGRLPSIHVVYTDREGREARIEMLIRSSEFVAGGVNAEGAAWEWPDGMTALSELRVATMDDILGLEKEFQAAVIACGGKLGSQRDQERQKEKRRRREQQQIDEPKRVRREDCRVEEWINQEALRRLDDWAPDLFPAARKSGDAYRVSPNALCRDCQEDLSFHPAGIMDFGAEQPHDAIGVIERFFRLGEDGELTPAEFDDDFRPLGNVTRERATIELCKLLNIDLEAERKRDFDQVQRDFDQVQGGGSQNGPVGG
jgi:hypothetical protein